MRYEGELVDFIPDGNGYYESQNGFLVEGCFEEGYLTNKKRIKLTNLCNGVEEQARFNKDILETESGSKYILYFENGNIIKIK